MLLLRARIKRFGQKHVQVVDGESQFSKFFGGILVPGADFEFPLHSAKAFAKRKAFLGIAEFLKEAFYFFDALQGGTNDARGRGSIRLPGLDALQQQAFEFAAILRALGINFALAAGECRARLFKFLNSCFDANEGEPE